jgi:hypothetical protein
LEFVTGSNWLESFAWLTGGGSFLASFLLLLFMLWQRSVASKTERARADFFARWEPVFFEQISGGSEPDLDYKFGNGDAPHLLLLWNYLHESVRGAAQENLTIVARQLDLGSHSLRALRGRKLDQKLLAITALGNLREASAWAELEKLTAHRDPIISLWAFRALIRIDFNRAAESHLRLVAERQDWSPPLVAAVLREFGADNISRPLKKLIRDSYAQGIPERQMARLISYLSLSHGKDRLRLAEEIFKTADKKEVLIACVRIAQSEKFLPKFRKLIKSEFWEVRMHAALALGHFGEEKDVKLLLIALNDIEWWVRYRAACALFSIPAMTRERIDEYIETLPNKFSRDMLLHVKSEIELKCLLQPSSFSLSK